MNNCTNKFCFLKFKDLFINIFVLCLMSYIGFIFVKRLIKSCGYMFLNESKANLSGKDLNKLSSQRIPEAQGLWCGVIYFIIMFLFMPISNRQYLMYSDEFPKTDFIQHLAGLLSICCMTLLGFVDDVLELKWRHKLLLPTIASLPLLIVYYITNGTTYIVVPVIMRNILGNVVDIGFFYYVYMGMLAVFCTNAINIYAGINGIEAGQSMVIAVSICCFNILEIFSGVLIQYQTFSLFFMIPYVFVCMGLLKFNWYPAEAFVGDTFCYFSGMTFAVVGIVGHFSKTLLLFFIPQIINFIYSTPQLFRLLPCPRHRLPRYVASTNKLTPSTTKFKLESLNKFGKICLFLLKSLRLIRVTHLDDDFIEINNLTIINFYLLIFGDEHESVLTKKLLIIQVLCTVTAFVIRYPVAWFFYG